MKFQDLVEKFENDKRNIPEYLKNDSNFCFEVSNLITEARMHAELTQEELSKLIKTKQPSVARWEAAVSLPSLRSLKKIADALGTYLIPPKFGFMINWNIKIDRVRYSGNEHPFIDIPPVDYQLLRPNMIETNSSVT